MISEKIKVGISVLALLICGYQASAQHGIGVYIGGSLFNPMEVESSIRDSYVQPVVWFPSPFVAIEYIRPMKNADYFLTATLKSTYYYQGFTTPFLEDDNQPSTWLKELQTVKAGNFNLNIGIEKTFFKGEHSRLNGALGVGVEAMVYRESVNYLFSNIDTIPSFQAAGDTKFHFSPTVNLGAIYRVKNKRGDFWNYGIDFVWAISKDLGFQGYSYGRPEVVENGNFVFRGSKISFKVGYLFQFNKTKTNQNE